MVWGSDSGQIQNPTHIEGMRWMIRVLLAYGITKEEVTNIFKTNPAKHLGIA
jgi:imidazolonepropionase-like amidohydrolase